MAMPGRGNAWVDCEVVGLRRATILALFKHVGADG
jgi:hypothetical protein